MADNYEGYEKIGKITTTFGELTDWVLEMLENKGVMVTTGPSGFFEIEIGVYRKNNKKIQ